MKPLEMNVRPGSDQPRGENVTTIVYLRVVSFWFLV